MVRFTHFLLRAIDRDKASLGLLCVLRSADPVTPDTAHRSGDPGPRRRRGVGAAPGALRPPGSGTPEHPHGAPRPGARGPSVRARGGAARGGAALRVDAARAVTNEISINDEDV